MKTVTLYRPVGPEELKLIESSNWTSFPPRLPEQPIFYPVVQEAYAAKIAQWNVAASGAGYVTKFAVEVSYLDQFETHEAGGQEHTEYWIPAESLDEFNRHIVGLIEVVSEFGKRSRDAGEGELNEVDRIYTTTNYWDGPRAGTASFRGAPHFFECEFDVELDEYASTYLLSPISDEVLSLALEDWAIWSRWDVAFGEGRTALETHPALPADRARRTQLAALLAGRLVIDRAACVRARAEITTPPELVRAARGGGAQIDVVWHLIPR